ncbi:MAG TPA: TonB-dependent receptor, partial [Rhizomicrobium sp.]|nr:TonB-dependent receptor [Rhizomicrobium sp.]
RLNAQWTPKLDFTDETMIYASYSRGYKGGGANPPGVGFNTTPIIGSWPFLQILSYSQTFKPEFINAYEVGTKNTLLDGTMTLNSGVFYYDYKDYQISQIRSRTAINENFNAKVWGAELEATWEPVPGLRFNFAGGYEKSRVGDNQLSIDPMDRLQGHTDYTIMKPWVQLPDNCVVLKSVVEQYVAQNANLNQLYRLCPGAAITNVQRNFGVTPDITPFGGNPDYPFDPVVFPNKGQGFYKNVGGNDLPNTPPFTLALGAQYSMPISSDWAATLRGDGYWQGNSFARIYNSKPYDQIHAYTNLNLTLIFTNQDGWQAMAYVKNVLDTTAITGTFLNSDDTALTTNIFTTDPRLFGLRITKNW